MSALIIKNMTFEEKMQAMEMLWDELCHDEKEVESPKWHGEVLEERKRQIESGETEIITLAELKARHR
jgi:hypothetical protein